MYIKMARDEMNKVTAKYEKLMDRLYEKLEMSHEFMITAKKLMDRQTLERERVIKRIKALKDKESK